MDMVKQMMMIAAFQNQQQGGGSGGGRQGAMSSIMTMAYTTIAIGLIEFILAKLPGILAYLHAQYVDRASKHFATQLQLNNRTSINDARADAEKVRTSITFELKTQTAQPAYPRQTNQGGESDVLAIAILDLVTNFKDTRSISCVNGQYLLNDNEPIQLTDDISAMLVKSTTSGTSEIEEGQTIEFFSYRLKMNELRAYVVEIQELYRLKVMNNLGTKLYYFNEIPVAAVKQMSPDGKTSVKSFHHIPPYFTYSMQEFVTNRRFTNLFGPEIDVIRNRVEFFINNKRWYDTKGIPYTLGLLLSGPPGTGKTSVIKCLANETGRYIINVNMHGDITKSQMQNLFFNETLMVIRNGMSVNIHVPIAKRIYVLEDVDCQGNIVLDRKLKAKMRDHISKVAKMEASAMANDSRVNSFDEGDAVPSFTPSTFTLPSVPSFNPYSVNPSFTLPSFAPPSFAPPSVPLSNPYSIKQLNPGALSQPTSSPTKSSRAAYGYQPTNAQPSSNYTEIHNKVATASMDTVAEGPELTMSFLLNLFDGILETPGRILVMTANEPEILDEALVRPGRMDVICNMDFCTNETICQIIEHFTDMPLRAEYRDIIMRTTPGLVTPAEMKKLLFEHMGKVDQAMDAIVTFIEARQ